jgi:N-methylhydantoinase B
VRGHQDIEITQPHIPVDLKCGDRLVTLSGGGAGVGPPEERDPEMVRKDVKNELVSVDMARNVYKVAIDPQSLAIDWPETRRLRKN